MEGAIWSKIIALLVLYFPGELLVEIRAVKPKTDDYTNMVDVRLI